MPNPNRIKIQKIIAGTIVIIAAIIFARTIVLAFFYFPENDAASLAALIKQTSQATPAQTSSSLPLRLVIPTIHVDAAVQYVGVNAAGNMRAPSNFTDVAWYAYGPTPGARGSAVMDGHVDNGIGLPGVFKHLSTLKLGDDIYVATKNGSRLHFVVADIESYPYTSAPADLIFNQNDAARLNLVTCEGAWVADQKTYDHRLVIFSTLTP